MIDDDETGNVMGLFINREFISHSGLSLEWKIDCDALNGADLETLARIVSRNWRFGEVVAIPRGGIRFAEALRPYCSQGPRLIVDDVLTTGSSMQSQYLPGDIGVVIFARGPCPDWVWPLFKIVECPY